MGDINLYPLFAELSTVITHQAGNSGMVIPSGIATDYYTQDFFAHLMATHCLRSFYAFENREAIFRDIHREYKFGLVLMGPSQRATDFAFFLTRQEHLEDAWRHFTLTEAEIELFNPNTRTCPIFRSQRDVELTRQIYRRHPVLIKEIYDDQGNQIGEENPWGIL